MNTDPTIALTVQDRTPAIRVAGFSVFRVGTTLSATTESWGTAVVEIERAADHQLERWVSLDPAVTLTASATSVRVGLTGERYLRLRVTTCDAAADPRLHIDWQLA